MIAFLIMVFAGGSIHGMWTDRWKPSQALQGALVRIERVPATFGDWTGTDNELDAETMASAGIRGYVYRTYRNTRTGTVISVLLVCGQGGPICVHTPDVCYSGSGYQIATGQKRVAMGEGKEFWTTQISKPDAIVPEKLHFFWSWSINGATWQAPDNPRWNLARYPAVFKLYVVRNLPQKAALEEGPIRDFLSAFLPELEKALGAS
jgi:hypothetical protein